MLNNRWTFLGLGLILPIVALVSFACSDDDDGPSEADAVAVLCADLSTLQAADAAFDDLGPTSTLDEIKATSSTYDDALDDAVSSARDVASVRVKPIEDAYADLDAAIGDISGSATVSEALDSISDELAAVDAAYVAAFSGVSCQ